MNEFPLPLIYVPYPFHPHTYLPLLPSAEPNPAVAINFVDEFPGQILFGRICCVLCRHHLSFEAES